MRAAILSLLFWGLGMGCGLLRSPGGVPEPEERTGFYPTLRRVPHPDSTYHLNLSFTEVEPLWSVGFVDIRNGRLFRTAYRQTYATLWAREVAMTWVAALVKQEQMTREQARQLADEQAELQSKYLTIVVHVFTNDRYRDAFFATDLNRFGFDFELRDDRGQVYRPVSVESESTHPIWSPSGGRLDAFYRMNVLRFARYQNGRDILSGVRRLTLAMRSVTGPGFQLQFRWEIEPKAFATARTDA
ncbi:MAG: hypothetical protein RML47_09515 [Bacteroidota bacterium]|nr:hypothetical protein [Rhodothermia bacterium]MDW8137829.1 hypothetical protein [Bacteroidota bacterium]MDW8286320.1 hypothetical protein [Bacteroidota bacterium]